MRTVVMVGVIAGCNYNPAKFEIRDPDAMIDGIVVDSAIDSPASCLRPAAHWQFDEGSGTAAADSSGHGNTLTLMGTATWATGQAGSALSLPGGSWAEIPYNSTFATTTEVSVTAWVHPTVLRTGGIVVKSARLGPFQDWGFYQEFAEGMFICNFPAPDNRGVTTGLALPTVEWTHLAFVLDTSAGGTAFYKNGVFHSMQSITTALLQHDEPISVGTDGGNSANDFVGSIDEVQVWTRALTATEVATIYAGDCIQ